MSNTVMDLVKIENNRVVTTSLVIAEKFEKNHRDVLKAIDNLIEKMALSRQSAKLGCAENMFFKSSYQAEESGRSYSMYLMNRDGFTLLVMGFTGDKALNFKLKFIEAFNRMENQLKYGSEKVPQTFLEALELAVEKEKQRIALEQKYIEEKERADEYQSTHELYESVTNKGGWISAKTVTDVLNILGLGRTNFYRFLRDQGIVTNKNQPMRCHIETKLMKARYDDFLEQYIVEFSFKGLKYIYAKLVQAKKIPSDLSEETWIKYCVDMETNEGDDNEIY